MSPAELVILRNRETNFKRSCFFMYTIDRIEGDLVICENRETREMIEFPRRQFPEDIRAGQLFDLAKEGVQMLQEDTEAVRKRLQDKMKALWK